MGVRSWETSDASWSRDGSTAPQVVPRQCEKLEALAGERIPARRGPLYPVGALCQRRDREPGRGPRALQQPEARDFLAASEHLAHWRERLDPDGHTSPELLEVAAGARWETAPDRSLSVTRAIYLRLSSGARLWLGGSEFEVAEPAELEAVLA